MIIVNSPVENERQLNYFGNFVKKQGDKKKKLTESLHLTVKIARRSNYNIDLRKLRVNKITGSRNHKAALNEKSTDSPQWFFIRSSI